MRAPMQASDALHDEFWCSYHSPIIISSCPITGFNITNLSRIIQKVVQQGTQIQRERSRIGIGSIQKNQQFICESTNARNVPIVNFCFANKGTITTNFPTTATMKY